MTIRQKASASALLLCAFAIVVPAPAGAQYLDPGAASIVVQAVVTGIVAVAAGLKLYWSRLSSIFSRRRPDDTASSDR